MPVNVDAVNYTISATDVSQAAVDSAVAGTKRVNAGVEAMGARMKGQFASIQKNWLMVSAGVTAAWFAVQKAWSMMDAAANYNERIAVLNALGQQYQMTGDQIVASMQKASGGTLSMRNAADLAAQSLNMALDPMQMTGFVEAVKALKRAIGGTIPEAYDTMVSAAAKGRVTMLREWGIIVDLEKAYEAKARATGRDKDQLSEAEKQQVRYNTVLEAAKKKIEELGPAQKSLKTEMSKLRATVDDTQLAFSQLMLRAGAFFLGVVKGAAAAGMALYWMAAKGVQGLAWLYSQIPGIGDHYKQAYQKATLEADAAYRAMNQLAQEGQDSMKAAFASNSDIAEATKKNTAEAETSAVEAESKRKARMENEKKDREAVADVLLNIRQRTEMDLYYADARELKALEQKHSGEMKKLIEHHATVAQQTEAHANQLTEIETLQQKQEKQKADDYYQMVIEERNARAEEERDFYRERARILTEIEAQRLRDQQYIRDIMSEFGQTGISGLDKIMEGLQAQTGMVETEYEKQRDAAWYHWQAMEEAHLWGEATYFETGRAYRAYDLAETNAANRQKYQSTVNFLKMSEGALSAYAAASGTQSKAIFLTLKAIQIAQALVAGHLMAIECAAHAGGEGGWKAALGVYLLCEALNFANAAAMAAVAIEQASSMGSQPSSAGGGNVSTTPSFAEQPTSRYEETAPPIVINVTINGSLMNNYDQLAREIIKPIQKAIQDGQH